MRILRRPMFKKGGSANSGIMHGLERRNYAESNWKDLAGIYKNLPIEIRKYDSPVVQDAASEVASTKDLYQDALLDYGWATGPKYKGPEWHEDIYIDEEGKLQKKEPSEMIKTPPGGTQLPLYKKPPPRNGDENGEKKVVDKRSILSDRAKEFYRLMSPHATKKLIADVTGAASESLSGSTGDTRQDIVNAITAAAGASGGQRKTYEDAMKLAIGESIQKGIAQATYKPNTMETLIALGRSDKPEDKALYKQLSKGENADANMLVTLMTKYQGLNTMKRALGDLFEIKANTANAKDYGGTLPADKKGEMADFGKMEKGKIYFNYFDGNFYKLDEKGEPKPTDKPDYLESSIPI